MNRISICKGMSSVRSHFVFQSIILGALTAVFAGCTMEMETDTDPFEAETTNEISQASTMQASMICTANKHWCEAQQRCIWFNQPCDPVNVALGKPVIFYGWGGEAPAPPVVTDGAFVPSPGTFWADSAYTFPFLGYVVVDLQQVHTIDYLVYQEYQDGCPGTIQVSADNSTWTDPYTAPYGTGWGWSTHTVTFKGGEQAQYVKYTSYGNSWCRASLSEIQAWVD